MHAQVQRGWPPEARRTAASGSEWTPSGTHHDERDDDGVRVMAASIAHEVKQPLSGMETNAAACLRMLSADPPDLEGAKATALRTIRDVNRAVQIIDRLRAHFGAAAPATGSVNLNSVVVDVLARATGELVANGVTARRNLAYQLPAVAGDRVQLEQVVHNLVRNAVEAMSSVHDRPRELVVTTWWHANGDVRLSVRDAGVGFRHEAAEQLFGAFYTTKRDGTGIGLALSRSLVERHRGRLWATPNPRGPGSTFSLSIPSSSRRSMHEANRSAATTPQRAPALCASEA